ncbi:hypothetical protein B0I35DRAFT_429886 [Stachybotrys elegans]|uniref:Secreted protein n=1 Tax=Stachybotrys elegans TaxID=80388 RepID=A0A8K0WRB3_9HYPO|nr:hypothetical protein B0I35DRAFT_429886 [Stachybotrys elegans]
MWRRLKAGSVSLVAALAEFGPIRARPWPHFISYFSHHAPRSRWEGLPMEVLRHLIADYGTCSIWFDCVHSPQSSPPRHTRPPAHTHALTHPCTHPFRFFAPSLLPCRGAKSGFLRVCHLLATQRHKRFARSPEESSVEAFASHEPHSSANLSRCVVLVGKAKRGGKVLSCPMMRERLCAGDA